MGFTRDELDRMATDELIKHRNEMLVDLDNVGHALAGRAGLYLVGFSPLVRIPVVKAIREVTGCGLHEAKLAMDANQFGPILLCATPLHNRDQPWFEAAMTTLKRFAIVELREAVPE